LYPCKSVFRVFNFEHDLRKILKSELGSMVENTTKGNLQDILWDHLKNLSQDWHGMTKLAVNDRPDSDLNLVTLKCKSEAFHWAKLLYVTYEACVSLSGFMFIFIYSLRHKMSCVKDIITWKSADLSAELKVIEIVT
jgi:ribonucleotide reductase beta subunit family protein with ferritin-like domain